MDKVYIQLHVVFEKPFWIGVFEIHHNELLYVSKVTFKSEPSDAEVYLWVLQHYMQLKFSPAVSDVVNEVKKNPKRIQREIRKQVFEKSISTKSQRALKLQQEQCKKEHQVVDKEKKKQDKQRLFELKQQKRKEKHRGH